MTPLSPAAALIACGVAFIAAAFTSFGHAGTAVRTHEPSTALVTTGVYGVVRNPIYTGMLGMLLATGLAVSHWLGLSIAIVVFAIGTFIRVRSEEKLLREAFSAEFDEYAQRVPAVIPFLI